MMGSMGRKVTGYVGCLKIDTLMRNNEGGEHKEECVKIKNIKKI